MSEKIPDDLRYTAEHEWVRREGKRFVVGVTDYAQAHLGDVVFVELPAVGRAVEKGAATAAVESVKAASDVFAPIAGTVVATNDSLSGSPEAVNRDPFGAGWFFAIEAAGDAEAAWSALLDAAAYRKHVAA